MATPVILFVPQSAPRNRNELEIRLGNPAEAEYSGSGMIQEHQLINDAMEGADLAWWSMELPSGVVFFHPNKTAMIGRTEEDFFHYTDFMKLVHPDDQEKTMEAMRQHIADKVDKYETTYRILHKDGHYVTFYDRGQIVEKRDGVTRIAGIVLDISSISHVVRDCVSEATSEDTPPSS